MEKIKALSFDRLRSSLNWEVGLYALLLVIALVMRLWELDARAFHYDESLHALYSWKLYTGQGYQHMPMMHGPFQFFGNALNFHIFGDSDFTARLLPAFFGTALVALPFFLRRQIGRWGALAAAILLTFSPLLLYYSRYARNDVYIAFWSLLLVICMWRYFEERKARYLYIGAAALSLSFCTKEVSYIMVAIFGSFLLILVAKELVTRLRGRLKLSSPLAPAAYLVLMATLALPLFAAAIAVPLRWLGVDLPRWQSTGTETVNVSWAIVLGVLLFVIAALIGLRWRWQVWLPCAAVFWGIFILFYTNFFHNTQEGIASGIWGSFDHWLAMHEEERISQPWYYYLMILPIYEFLPLLFAFIGAIYYTIKGNTFSRFLVYWAALSLILYSFAGEKVPWLSLYIALPIILLGGMFIGRLFQAFDWEGAKAWAIRGVTVLVLLLLFSYTVHVAFQESYQKGDKPPQMLLYAGMSSDMPQIMNQIEELARETEEGKELEITLDYPLYWDWSWYLRDYNVDWPDLSSINQPPRGSVLLLDPGHQPAAEPYLGKYDDGQRFRERLWFPEEYRDFNLGWWWGYFLHRETLGPYWTSEGIVYFPKSAP